MLGFGLTGWAQTVQYTIRYNLTLSRYEVYAKPSFSQSQYNWGSSQITIVTPSSLTNVAFSVVSTAAGGWTDNSQVYDVFGSDFHGVGSTGLKVDLVADQEVLLFHFVLASGQCIPGLRLFINGTDPGSIAPGMNGGDFSNTMYSSGDILGSNNLYIANYANTGTVCTACNLQAPILSKL
ncbi:hypothetical protein F5984_22455 [Rudanella paleaurantiibacter]|uniref:Uncharacterized protein n=1 Tax=Rudanella paleaurantiibacter TaxID=2614655 RepID=A0A7J5TUS2_9BACT|nr:hypothetical protein F5984_22455 [Rudanella paleaurantiibacter]